MNNRLKPVIWLPLPAFSIITLFVVLIITGIAVTPLLSVQLEPSRTNNSITISFNWPAPAELMEQDVSAKIEGAISVVKGIKNVRSVSSDDHGYVQADLDERSDINQARYEITAIIRQLYPNLPAGVSYPVVSVNRPAGKENRSILTYTINGRADAASIQELAEKQIKPRLALLPGVYQVNIYGAGSYAWELQYDPAAMIRYNISEQDIRSGLSAYFTKYELGKAHIISNAGAGYSYLTLHAGNRGQIQWNNIMIKKTGGRTIYLTDLVNVRFAEQEPSSLYRINGLNTVNLEISAVKNSNYLVLADQVKKEIKAVQRELSAGHSVILAYDATEYLKTELDKITWRLLATLIILLLFVFAVSRSVRYLLMILISLVSNLLLAFILYYFFRLEIHLYSLAGITVSMGMIIDNSIVMIDHIRHKRNMRVFLAVTGATLTTIGAVCIIFFLNEQQQVKLLDFAWVMIINLSISLLIAFCLIPALMEKLPLSPQKLSRLIRRKRKVVRWNRFYARLIFFGSHYRLYLIVAAILLFGIPVFLLPSKIEKDTRWAKLYNASIGSELYNESFRPWTDKILGGTLRLFTSRGELFQYNNESSERTRLTIGISMPKGAGLQQMNQVVIGFENYLSQFKEIEQFQSRIYSREYANIAILFKKEFDQGSFPYALKSRLESKAVYTGLAEFSISGVGQGFNNELNTESANYGLILLGYNYKKLYSFAEQVKSLLLENPRVEKVSIASERDWSGEKSNYEYVFRMNSPERLLINQLSPSMISKSLAGFSGDKKTIDHILYNQDYVPVVLSPGNGRASSVWQVMNEAVRSDSGAYVRLKEFATIDKEKAGDYILKENQQYQLVVNYNFIGDNYLGTLVAERITMQVSSALPLGYSVKETKYNFWKDSRDKLVWAILLTIGIVFVICAILLNSVLQPLAVIAMIPISFIGVFLVSWLFEYRFDEGGYAAFIILCGVVVSAALYILNDYNNLLRDFPDRPRNLLFIKAYNSKIIPVLLSRISIILGLSPFIVYSRNEPFWYALAMSVTGGLLFSMVAIILFLPIFLKGTGNHDPNKMRHRHIKFFTSPRKMMQKMKGGIWSNS